MGKIYKTPEMGVGIKEEEREAKVLCASFYLYWWHWEVRRENHPLCLFFFSDLEPATYLSNFHHKQGGDGS